MVHSYAEPMAVPARNVLAFGVVVVMIIAAPGRAHAGRLPRRGPQSVLREQFCGRADAVASRRLDTADFEIAARALLGAEVGLFSDRVLGKPHVSPDLIAAQPV